MHVLLYLEHLVLSLQVHADADVQRLVLVGQRVVVGVLDVASCKLVPLGYVDVVLDELRVQVVSDEVLALQVHHGALLSFLVYQHDGADAGLLGYKGIVGAEVWRYVHDAGAVLRGDVVARNDAEGVAHGLDGRHQLLVLHAHEVSALVSGYDAIGYQLLALLVLRHLATVRDGSLGGQVGVQTGLGQHQRHLVGGIGVVGLDGHVVNLRPYAECRVGSQCPRRGGPSQEVRCSPACHLGLRVLHLELCSTCGVLHVAIASGLVQLVARQARAGCGRIGLYGVSLVEQALLVELLQQPPQGLDVLVVVGDVGMVQVDEVAHLLGQLAPLLGEHHHVLAALAVVVLGRDVALRLLVVDVGLGDAQLLLHAQLYGQSVGVPSGLAPDLVAAHGLIAVEGVLDAACQHVVDAGVSVGRGGTLEEHKLGTALALVD